MGPQGTLVEALLQEEHRLAAAGIEVPVPRCRRRARSWRAGVSTTPEGVDSERATGCPRVRPPGGASADRRGNGAGKHDPRREHYTDREGRA